MSHVGLVLIHPSSPQLRPLRLRNPRHPDPLCHSATVQPLPLTTMVSMLHRIQASEQLNRNHSPQHNKILLISTIQPLFPFSIYLRNTTNPKSYYTYFQSNTLQWFVPISQRRLGLAQPRGFQHSTWSCSCKLEGQNVIMEDKKIATNMRIYTGRFSY